MMQNTTNTYFELSWSILSTIGMITSFIGVMVCGIIGFSAISLVPIIVSAACAIANGLCYYASYSNYSTNHRVVAGAFADITWLIQEVGLSFYSYQILYRVLSGKQKKVFLTLFWLLVCSITAVRVTILIHRAIDVSHNSLALQHTIDHLHVAYFTMIALTECLCSYFLIRTFHRASTSSSVLTSTSSNIFKRLSRSAEIRLATLAPIGVCRAITYSFQRDPQEATDTVGELDRFMYSLECLFPIVMIVDLLASRLPNRGSATQMRVPATMHHQGIDRDTAMEFQKRQSQHREHFLRLGPLREIRSNEPV